MGIFEIGVMMLIAFVVGWIIGVFMGDSRYNKVIIERATDKEPLNIGDCRFKVIPANKIALAKCSPDEDV